MYVCTTHFVWTTDGSLNAPRCLLLLQITRGTLWHGEMLPVCCTAPHLSHLRTLFDRHRHGNDFSVGGQKLNKFLVGCGSQNLWKTVKTIKFKVQVFPLCIFFEKKGTRTVHFGELSRIFVLTVTLQSKVTFKCKLQKKIGEQDVLFVPPIILLGATAPPDPMPMFNAFHS